MLYGITHSHQRIVTGVSGEPGYNPDDKAFGVQLTNSNKTVTKFADDGSYSSIRSMQGRTSGLWYFEHTIEPGGDLDIYFGICTDAMSVDNWVGDDTDGDSGASLGYQGYTYPNTHPTLDDFIGEFTFGDVIGCAVDLDSGLIWWRVNDGLWNGNAASDPETGEGGFTFRKDHEGNPRPIVGTIWHVGFSAWTVGCSATANFGESAFAHTAPSGYAGWSVGSPPTDTLTIESLWRTEFRNAENNNFANIWPELPATSVAALSNNSAESVAASSKTFTGMDIGAASDDRQVLLLLTMKGHASEVMSSVKIRPNGDAGLEKDCSVTEVFNGTACRGYAAIAHVPDNYTTADVIVNFSGSEAKDLFCQSLKTTGVSFLVPWPYFGVSHNGSGQTGPSSTFDMLSTGSPYQVQNRAKEGALLVHFGVWGDAITDFDWTATTMTAPYSFGPSQNSFKAHCGVRGPLPQDASHNTGWTVDASVQHFNGFFMLR